MRNGIYLALALGALSAQGGYDVGSHSFNEPPRWSSSLIEVCAEKSSRVNLGRWVSDPEGDPVSIWARALPPGIALGAGGDLGVSAAPAGDLAMELLASDGEKATERRVVIRRRSCP